MYLYFDANGYLKEFINDPYRESAVNVNKIYFYVEKEIDKIAENGTFLFPLEYTKCLVNFKLPQPITGVTDENGVLLNPIVYQISNNTVVEKQLPYNPKRDLLFFEYGRTYQFVEVSMNINASHTALEEAGNVDCSLSLLTDLNNNGEWNSGEVLRPLDTFSFYVNGTAVVKSVYITESQYHYLLGLYGAAIAGHPTFQDAIVVLNNIQTADLSAFNEGQLFYNKDSQQYFIKKDGSYELADEQSGLLGKKYVDEQDRQLKNYVDYLNNATFSYVESLVDLIADYYVGNDTLYVEGTVSDTTIYPTDATIDDTTIEFTTSYIFYTKAEVDTLLAGYVPTSTLTNYYTKTETDNLLSQKVDKTSDEEKVYGTDENGSQTLYDIDSDFISDGKIVRRISGSGAIITGNPTAINHATTKKYVDDGLALKADQNNTYTKAEVESIVATLKANSYIEVDTTDYPTLEDFLDDYTGQEEGHIYLYPIDTNDLTKGYYQYIWESNAWLDIGTTQIDLSDYVTKSTNQTITGTKTFEGDLKVKGSGTTTVGQMTTTNYALKLGFGGINHITIGSNNFYTNVADYDLGSNSNKWRDAYISRYLTDGTHTITVANIVATNSLLASDSDIADIMEA